MGGDIRTELDKMAVSLIGTAQDVPLDAQLDIFKTVSTYYLGCNRSGKSGSSSDDADQNKPSKFTDIVEKLQKETEQ